MRWWEDKEASDALSWRGEQYEKGCFASFLLEDASICTMILEMVVEMISPGTWLSSQGKRI